jgi:hypothetical protein
MIQPQPPSSMDRRRSITSISFAKIGRIEITFDRRAAAVTRRDLLPLKNFERYKSRRPYDFTAPAVMPSMKRRCRATKTTTTGSTMMTAAASISPQSVEYCPVRL